MDQISMDHSVEQDRLATATEQPRSDKVIVSVKVHPTDYLRMCRVAKMSGIPEADFMALAMHRGACEIAAVYAIAKEALQSDRRC